MMNYSTSTLISVLIGLGVFAVIVAVGWRSVQNRRIVRLRSADGQETIIVAGEDDDISSVVTTTETTQSAPATANIRTDAPVPDLDGEESPQRLI